MAMMKAIEYVGFRTAYGARLKVATAPVGASMTEQCHTQECDVNRIVNRYHKTGVLGQQANKVLQYGFAPALDFRDALDLVRAAEAQFAAVPSDIRKRFDNNPATFLAFVENPANAEELVKMGLAKVPEKAPEPAPTPPPAPVPAE